MAVSRRKTAHHTLKLLLPNGWEEVYLQPSLPLLSPPTHFLLFLGTGDPPSDCDKPPEAVVLDEDNDSDEPPEV